jgi:hypothetical protein
MEHTERWPATPLRPPTNVVGEWYLKGFADAYNAHWAVVPSGPAGEQYQRGYALGLAAVRREFFVATLKSFLDFPRSADT